eukprot:7765429-Lingulodinium_polyedra.AAC.1
MPPPYPRGVAIDAEVRPVRPVQLERSRVSIPLGFDGGGRDAAQPVLPGLLWARQFLRPRPRRARRGHRRPVRE